MIRLLIFTEISKKIGGGHYERSIRIKEKLKEKFKVFLYVNRKKKEIKNILSNTIESCIIIYDFKHHSKSIILKNDKFFFILMESNGISNNNTIHIDPLNLSSGEYNGPRWSAYPEDFFKNFKKIVSKKKRLLISQGLTDAHDNIEKIINLIEPLIKIYDFEIIVKCSNFIKIPKKYMKNKKIKFVRRIRNISDLLNKVQFAITSCGNFCHEINFFGIRTMFITSESREIKRAKRMEKLDFGKYVNLKDKEKMVYQFKKFINMKNYWRRDIKKTNFFQKNGMQNLVKLILKIEKNVQK